MASAKEWQAAAVVLHVFKSQNLWILAKHSAEPFVERGESEDMHVFHERSIGESDAHSTSVAITGFSAHGLM